MARVCRDTTKKRSILQGQTNLLGPALLPTVSTATVSTTTVSTSVEAAAAAIELSGSVAGGCCLDFHRLALKLVRTAAHYLQLINH